MTAADVCLGLSVQSSVIGFAVYSRAVGLLDWGTICCRYGRGERALLKITDLFETYHPIQLSIDDHRAKAFRRGETARSRIKQTIRLARNRKVTVSRLSPSELKQGLKLSPSSNRYEIAVLIAELFPVLADRLPQPRKIWQSEPRGMSMFMAVALAVTE